METVTWRIEDTAWTLALKKRGSIYFTYKDVVLRYPFLRLHHSWLAARAKIFNRAIVHVIGDSNAMPFVFKNPFMVHHISQATAHNLSKDASATRSKKYLNSFLSRINKKRDVVILVFGEIDARVHIYYQYGKRGGKVSIEELVAVTVERYGETVKRLQRDGFAVCVHGIPPAARKNFVSDLPFLGTPEQRSQISRILSIQLNKLCERIGVPYIDVQSVAADEGGFIAKEYLADEVHLNGNIVPFVMARMKEAFEDTRRFL